MSKWHIAYRNMCCWFCNTNSSFLYYNRFLLRAFPLYHWTQFDGSVSQRNSSFSYPSTQPMTQVLSLKYKSWAKWHNECVWMWFIPATMPGEGCHVIPVVMLPSPWKLPGSCPFFAMFSASSLILKLGIWKKNTQFFPTFSQIEILHSAKEGEKSNKIIPSLSGRC